MGCLKLQKTYYQKPLKVAYTAKFQASCEAKRVQMWLSVDPLWEKVGPNRSPYEYTYSNPIRYIDPTGMEPTPEEAAELANHIYDASQKNIGKIVPNSGGFKLDKINTDPDNPGYKSGVYSRKGKDGMEYVMANMGTDFDLTTEAGRDSASEDLEQPFGGSEHMKLSLKHADELIKDVGKNADVTFTGHSKGGAEAAGNALKTNKNAMLFNPAAINAGAYGLDTSAYKGNMTAYVVSGDPVGIFNSLLGANPIDKIIYLPTSHSIFTPLSNHSNYRESLHKYTNPTIGPSGGRYGTKPRN